MRHMPGLPRHLCRQFIVLVCLLLALSGLAACSGSGVGGGLGTSATPTAATRTPTAAVTTSTSAVALVCSYQEQLRPVDSIQVILSCTVTHAPSSATSFTLRYRLTDKVGAQHLLQPDCIGALKNGQGACHQTYALTLPLASALAHGVVTGALEPDQSPLGPVAPTP